MAVFSMCKVTVWSLLLVSSATSDCEVPSGDADHLSRGCRSGCRDLPGSCTSRHQLASRSVAGAKEVVQGTGLLQTKQGTKALEKTSFEENVLSVMQKMEEELKELKNEDAGLKEELARLESSGAQGKADAAEVPRTPRGHLDLQAILAQHQNASERRSSCRKAAPLPFASVAEGKESETPILQQKQAKQGNWKLVLKVGKTATLGFSSPLWTNSELLNEASEMAAAEDAKYSEFNTEPFKKMRMCIGSPLSNCVEHAFETRYDSAKALFSAGYIRDGSVKQDEILKTFGPAKGSYRDCPMQRPGFNIECRDGNKARWGWCANCPSQGCQSDSGDADAAIGLGIAGQKTDSELGAGWTSYFASGADTCSANSKTFKAVWLWVESLSKPDQASCASGQVKLRDFQPAGIAETCCPRSKVACAGCASFTGGSCQKCADGFIVRDGKCMACTSSGGWLNAAGKSCMQLTASDCSDDKVRGQSSNEACCQCGGGFATPTPFSYPNSRWSLDSNIVMQPEPRTAERYTVDAKCELAAHNLTIDSSTGEISYMSGRAKPTEAFSFECEVTAHQATGVSLASVVTIAADVLSYSSATLLFHSDKATERPLTAGTRWSKFELGCAPEVSWLSIARSDGTLSYKAPSGATGGVSIADDKFFGQDGAVCVVTAWQAHKKHQTTIVAIRPRPWPKLEYDLEAVSVSVGEELHPLSPKPHTEQGLMKPWTFGMACGVWPAGSTKFSYDRILNMGLLAGHPVLDISSDGTITVAPASTLSEVFDALSVSGEQRKAFTLGCRVYGIFPDPELAPVEATLTIVVQDTVCWVPQQIKGIGRPDPDANTEAKCRSQCRADETCANYQFDSQCVRYDVRSDGNPVTVIAKVTNCTNEGTCMKVAHSDWYLAGTYCPLGRDAVLGGIVYLREHVTPQDMVYLREGSTGGCGAGEWALLAPSSEDFVDKGLGLFELRGTRQACIRSSSVEHALQGCPTKQLAWIEEQEEDEEGQPSLVLDDPATAQLADFWLHPCDCAPEAWGPQLPVDPQMYEHLPANSSNQFIPTPYVIVTGQLVCPSRQLLGGSNGVHFQSEEESVETTDCEARCREQSTCLFFWHGSQHGASTCRLFTGCDNLVREFSLEGDLKAMPRSQSCTVADAAKCWAASLRRSFLTMDFNPNGANSVAAGGGVGLNLPPKPAAPPSDGMVAWFESENAGSVWRSSVGDFEGYCSKNSVFRRVEAGHGADRPVTFIEGYASSGFTFGDVLAPTNSVCSITRYARGRDGGSHRKRILQSKSSRNWLHGHWSGHAGVIYYNSWVTPKSAYKDALDWLVLCGTNGAKRAFDGMSSGTPTNIATGSAKKFSDTVPLYVNHGTDQKSDYAVMEVITWDRVLSEAEMLATVDYLKWKLRAGAVLEASEHLATESQHNLDSWGVQDLNDMASKTTEVTFANGYKADLTGWTNTRQYARGFIINNGVSTAVVKGLAPAAQYLYQIYMVHERSDWQGEAYISVNHGVQGRGYGNSLSEAKFSGVAVASPRGEINFEFARIAKHCHLTSIAIAKVISAPVGLLQETSAAKVQSQGAVSAGFMHLHLYQQCDTILLLGGMGVQQCGRPSHREIDSHDWQHKRPLPPAFQHGSLLMASCWSERYRLLRQNRLSDSERLQCVNGDWYNSLGKPGLNGLTCEGCVQVGARGYAAYDERNEQELYFFNRMALSIYTELGMIKELDMHAMHKYCLQPSSDGNMTVQASSACPPRLLSQVTGRAGPEARLFKLLPLAEDDEQCLSTKGSTSGLMHVNCNATDAAQHLVPAELPTDMWDLHIEADERTQDLHKPFSSYCGTSGALSSLDFGQLFAGDTGSSQTACKFAPLIQFGEFVDTGIVRSKTTTNWKDWHHLLAENSVECESGEALTAFKLDAAKSIYKYECSKIGGLGACFDYYSAQVEIASFSQSISHWAKSIRMMPVSCGQNAILGGFHFEFSEGGKWGRVRYQCCKAGGAPVSFDPRGQLPELVGSYDGIYCPSSRDEQSGRVSFEGGSDRTLSFQRKSGKWCLNSECSEVTNSASPVGMTGAAFEVVNVSDFDGEFLGQMPKEKNKALSLAEALRMKPPRRPAQPPMPELEEFKAQQPKYAAECLNYENLWKDVTETFKDEEDEEVQRTSKLEADPSTKDQELDSYHPCEVAKTAGGIFGQWGGGDGSTAPENMMYADWNDCMQGDIERDLASAQLDYHSALTDFIMDLVGETMGAVCDVIPDVMIAPFGAGVALNPSEICTGINDLLGAAQNFAGPASGFHFARQSWSIEQEGYAACNPMQIGFARAFCDIHCVRDAVIRGDRSIIRNLEMATKKTNNNLKALVKWSVDASHTDIGWIGEKLDYMHAINTGYMKDIHDLVTLQSRAGEEELLQGTKKATDSMFAELAGYAQAASFDELSKITAKGALEEFLKSTDFSPKANATAAASLLGRLDVLHQTLQRAGRGRDKGEMLSRQVAQTVRHLQRQASFHLRTLGVYRQESNASSQAARGKASKASKALARERHQVLMSLDHIWWQLRTKLDSYLDVAEDEVKAFQGSLVELKSYLDCKKGFSDLAAGYAQSMSALGRSHRHLRATWRQGTNLLGELASVLADTEAFQGFVIEQGCESELVKQTLQQLQSGIFGMAFLLHRFRAAKLPDPDTSALKQSTKRIQEAYAAATAKCH